MASHSGSGIQNNATGKSIAQGSAQQYNTHTINVRKRIRVINNLADEKRDGQSRRPRPTPTSTVPFRRDRDFVDREILFEIHQKCSSRASRVALFGLGAKSQLAIEYSYRVQEELPETWIFWVHASTAARFEEGYRAIAERVQIDGRDKPDVNILQLVSNWLCDERNGVWLMIVDNADDANVFFDQSTDYGVARVARSFSDFLPQSPNEAIIITSRSREVAFRLTGRHPDVIEVGPMDLDHALALLQKKLPTDIEWASAVELVQTLDHMPLAITQAAAYISQNTRHITISKYLHNLQQGDKDRVRLLRRDFGDIRRDARAPNSIMATWEISFEHLRKEQPSAARLLSLMCLFDRQGIPLSLLLRVYEEDIYEDADLDDDIATLRNYSFVMINVEGNEFEMHRLVQLSTKVWLQKSGELEKWIERYISIGDIAFPDGQYENWAIFRQLFPHACMVLLYQPNSQDYLEHLVSILRKVANYSVGKGSYEQAEERNRRALSGSEKALGKEHPDSLMSVSNLALVLQYQGKYEQAEEMTRRALSGYEKALGNEHPHTLTSVSILADILRGHGKYDQAEEMNRRALSGREKALGKEHPDTLTSVDNLAGVLRDHGKYEQAEEMN